MTENTQKQYTIRIIMTMFGLLMVAIVLNAALLVVRLNRALLLHMVQDANAQLSLVQTLHNQQIEENAIIANIVREQNQRFCDFLDYDNVKALSYMLKTIATLHNIDMVLLYNENDQLITTYPAGSDIAEPNLYDDFLKTPANWNGVGIVDRTVLKEQNNELFSLVKDPKIICFQSSVDLIHDCGDIYGRVILIRFLHSNPILTEKMADLSEVEVIYYNEFFQPMWSTIQSDAVPFPQQNRIQVDEKTYLAVHHDIQNHEGKTVGYLAAALVQGPLLKHRNKVILYGLLPLIIAAVISLIIFLLLKRRVFDKIQTLSRALRSVTQSRTDFSIRIPTPIKEKNSSYDEVISMAIDFNQMMAKLEDTYHQMVAAQQEVEKANHELEERVRQRTAELSLSNENLRAEIAERQRAEMERRQLEQQLQRAQKMEAIGTLAGGVAHDLNNILSGIVSYPELIMIGLSGDNPIRKPLEDIHKSGLKAAAIVQDLLALARRGVFEPEVTNLNEIIREYLTSPEFLNLQKSCPAVHIETYLAEDLFNISGSAVHLTKVIMNLVSNGYEAIGNQGRLIVRTENTYVDRPFRGYDQVQEGDYVQLSISDSGGGIDDADINQIFEPFFTRKKMGRSGSGLGLTVVWATIKDHNGYIDIQSRKDEGTTFHLYFPMTNRLPTGEPAMEMDEDYRGHGEHILVVDDVDEQLDIAGGLLKSLGYRVSTASSGEKAVTFIRHTPVDVLILDMIMEPGIDGLETYRRILEQCPGQKAIIASGFAESDKVKAALALGAAKFIKKPYRLKDIGRAVKTALGNSLPT